MKKLGLTLVAVSVAGTLTGCANTVFSDDGQCGQITGPVFPGVYLLADSLLDGFLEGDFSLEVPLEEPFAPTYSFSADDVTSVFAARHIALDELVFDGSPYDVAGLHVVGEEDLLPSVIPNPSASPPSTSPVSSATIDYSPAAGALPFIGAFDTGPFTESGISSVPWILPVDVFALCGDDEARDALVVDRLRGSEGESALSNLTNSSSLRTYPGFDESAFEWTVGNGSAPSLTVNSHIVDGVEFEPVVTNWAVIPWFSFMGEPTGNAHVDSALAFNAFLLLLDGFDDAGFETLQQLSPLDLDAYEGEGVSFDAFELPWTLAEFGEAVRLLLNFSEGSEGSAEFAVTHMFVQALAISSTGPLDESDVELLSIRYTFEEITQLAQNEVPYFGPVVTNDPETAQSGSTVTYTGSDLDEVISATISGQSAAIVSKSASSLTLRVPAGLTQGMHDVVLQYSSTEQITLQNGLVIQDSMKAWTKLQADNTVKMYAKNIIGEGKIQFFHNGNEIAWIRATNSLNPKLSSANGSHYLVRTRELTDGKNIFEIFDDGVRVWRAAYSR